MGGSGGLMESDLTTVLLRTNESRGNFVALDAGTVLSGLNGFVAMNNMTFMNALFPGLPTWLSSVDPTKLSADASAQFNMTLSGYIMKQFILGYFIGHSHLDHVMGLAITSPEGSYFNNVTVDYYRPNSKSIVGSVNTTNDLMNYIFNGAMWPNIPKLTNWYQYQTLEYGLQYYVNDVLYMASTSFDKSQSGTHQIQNYQCNYLFSDTTVTMFPLCHSNPSSAFLFESQGIQLIYFSDTGLDTTTNCDWKSKVQTIWNAIDISKLRAILIEVSFPNDVTDGNLFGHMRPRDLLSILSDLKSLKGSLSKVQVVVTHVKPRFTSDFTQSSKTLVLQQLTSGANELLLDCTFATANQGNFFCYEK